jgi:hypothetical protein
MTTEAALSRVQYFDKQFLRVDEFLDEQLYQLALHRRHEIFAHTWGIVRGLELAIEDESTVVRPGLAIDGYGRELLLTAKQRLAAESFDNYATDRLDVWLVYDRQDEGSAPAGYGGCGASGGSSYRSVEKPKVLVERTLSNRVEARRPPGVPTEVLDAVVPPLSDDPHDAWRVYLGRWMRVDGEIIVDAAHRPYAGVVAERVDHPANATRVEVGGQSEKTRTVGGKEYTYEESAERRFAIFVPEADEHPLLAPRLEVLAGDIIRLRGETIVHGNVRTVGGAVQFAGATTEEQARDKVSIYRSTANGADELRIDLGTLGTPARQFAIGFSTADGTFKPCLTIVMDPTKNTPVVTIHGDLQVNGKVLGTFIPPALTPGAMAALFASFAAGQSGNAV